MNQHNNDEKYQQSLVPKVEGDQDNDSIEQVTAEEIHSIMAAEFAGVTKKDLAIMDKWKVSSLEGLAKLQVAKSKLSAQVDVFAQKLSAAKKIELIRVENQLLKMEHELESQRAVILQGVGLKAKDDQMQTLIQTSRMYRKHLKEIAEEKFEEELEFVKEKLLRAAKTIYESTFDENMAELGSILKGVAQKDRKEADEMFSKRH
jgi:hypothetical protein